MKPQKPAYRPTPESLEIVRGLNSAPAAKLRRLTLATVKWSKRDGWIIDRGVKISGVSGFKSGREALEWAVAEGYQVTYRGLTYNDGGYLNGVRAQEVSK